jgi:hypothetical protein
MLIGTVMAAGSGAAFPLMTVIFGSVLFQFPSTHNSLSLLSQILHTSMSKANLIL